jgi:hypothetical protein
MLRLSGSHDSAWLQGVPYFYQSDVSGPDDLAMRSVVQPNSHIPIIPFHRWDEKAGLRRDALWRVARPLKLNLGCPVLRS